jgi:hypothetical protein
LSSAINTVFRIAVTCLLGSYFACPGDSSIRWTPETARMLARNPAAGTKEPAGCITSQLMNPSVKICHSAGRLAPRAYSKRRSPRELASSVCNLSAVEDLDFSESEEILLARQVRLRSHHRSNVGGGCAARRDCLQMELTIPQSRWSRMPMRLSSFEGDLTWRFRGSRRFERAGN